MLGFNPLSSTPMSSIEEQENFLDVVLDPFTSNASGITSPSGTVDVTLDAFISSATGLVAQPVTGSVSVTLDSFTSNASGLIGQPVTGTVNVALDAFTSSASGITGSPTLSPIDVNNIVNAIFNRIVEPTETFEQQLRLIRAEAAGKLIVSGDTVALRSAADNKDRIFATVDNAGQRTSIVTDAD